MTMATNATRCWMYLKDGCRQPATNSVRYGALAYHFCDNPKHAPKAPRKGRKS